MSVFSSRTHFCGNVMSSKKNKTSFMHLQCFLHHLKITGSFITLSKVSSTNFSRRSICSEIHRTAFSNLSRKVVHEFWSDAPDFDISLTVLSSWSQARSVQSPAPLTSPLPCYPNHWISFRTWRKYLRCDSNARHITATICHSRRRSNPIALDPFHGIPEVFICANSMDTEKAHYWLISSKFIIMAEIIKNPLFSQKEIRKE
jgi:hypothetical protein